MYFLGNNTKKFICRRCLNSYTEENTLLNHKEECRDYDICTTRTSCESHLQLKDQFHKNSKLFRIISDFEADNEIDISSIGKKQLIFVNKILCVKVII